MNVSQIMVSSEAKCAKVQLISASSRNSSDKASTVCMCVSSRRLTETLFCVRVCSACNSSLCLIERLL